MVETTIRKVVNLHGSQQKLAARLNLPRCVVNSWVNSRINIPLKYALDMEALTQGLVKAEDLAPYATEQILRFRKFILQQYHA